MSNLRDRLKQVSQKPQTPAPDPALSVCREIKTRHPAHGVLSIPPEILALLGGEGIRRPLFLDTETTGLGGGAGTLAFMVGVGLIEEDGLLHVTQYLMTDYDQEEDLLTKLLRDARRADGLVTYNGKSFDIPLLRSRLVMNRLSPCALELPHIDLLHVARRVYKRRLKRCTLVDMEENILGIHRENDLPGALAPEYWFRYLKTGEEHLLDEILTHNEQDIVTLAQLLRSLADAYSGPDQLTFELDRLSVGKAMEKIGETARAAAYYRAAAHQSDALLALARIHRRSEEFANAVDALERAALMDGGTVPAMVELSKLYEHRLRQYQTALMWVDRALAAAKPFDIEPLTRRRARLRRKIRRQEEKS